MTTTGSGGTGSGWGRGRSMRREGRGRFLSTTVSSQDFQTLTEIKAYTSFTGSSTWQAGADCELNELFGVVCDALGRVVSLSLQLSTAPLLAPSICNLDQLTGLTFLQGGTASLPTCLSSLGSVLQSLSITETELAGPLPSVLFSLTRLSSLSLRANQLAGSIPSDISSLAQLKTLNLGFNSLSGTFPQQFSKLVALRAL